MFKLSSHWKIVIVATLFNLLAEFAIRGVNNMTHSLILPVGLFLNYFFYFVVIESEIARHKFTDKHLALIALFYVLLWQLLGPSVVYFPPLILGVNWLAVFFVAPIWWIPLQTIFCMYLANRISPRNWDEPFIRDKGLKASMIAFVVVTLAFRILAPIAPINVLGFLVMLILVVLSGRWYQRMVKKVTATPLPVTPFVADRFLDVLGIIVLVYFIVSGTVLTKDSTIAQATQLNMSALRLNLKVSVFCVLLLLIRRFTTKRPISV